MKCIFMTLLIYLTKLKVATIQPLKIVREKAANIFHTSMISKLVMHVVLGEAALFMKIQHWFNKIAKINFYLSNTIFSLGILN